MKLQFEIPKCSLVHAGLLHLKIICAMLSLGTVGFCQPPPPLPSEQPPPLPSSEIWVEIDGIAKGPFGFSVINTKVKSGEITKETLVWMKGMDDWQKAGSIDRFERLFRQPMDQEPVATLDILTKEMPQDWQAGKRLGNSLAIQFAWCPDGKFLMGSPPSERDRADNETQANVSLTGFWISRHEVSNRLYRKVMGRPSSSEDENLPASVTWNEAVKFCGALTQLEKQAGLPANYTYGLPSEAQWEYACRAGTSTAFSFGDAVEKIDEYGLVKSQSPGPVEVRKSNPWGIFDMHGNASEWCLDCFIEEAPGGHNPNTWYVTADGQAPEHSVRGGRANEPAHRSRSAARISGGE